jgi:hypothetical protein
MKLSVFYTIVPMSSSRLQVVIVGAGTIYCPSPQVGHILKNCTGIGGLAAGAFLREYADVTVCLLLLFSTCLGDMLMNTHFTDSRVSFRAKGNRSCCHHRCGWWQNLATVQHRSCPRRRHSPRQYDTLEYQWQQAYRGSASPCCTIRRSHIESTNARSDDIPS